MWPRHWWRRLKWPHRWQRRHSEDAALDGVVGALEAPAALEAEDDPAVPVAVLVTVDGVAAGVDEPAATVAAAGARRPWPEVAAAVVALPA